MARPKKSAVPQIPTNKQFQVITRFKGNINNRLFECLVGDLIELNPFEAECLKTYIKETE